MFYESGPHGFWLPGLPPEIRLEQSEADDFHDRTQAVLQLPAVGLAERLHQIIAEVYATARHEVTSWPWEGLSNETIVGLLRAHSRTRENAFRFLSAVAGPFEYSRAAHVAMPEMVLTDCTPVDPEREGDPFRVLTFPRRWFYLYYLLTSARPLLWHDLVLHAAFVPANKRVVHRLKGHPVSAQVAVALLSHRWLSLDRISGEIEAARDRALQSLGRITSAKVPAVVFSHLQARDADAARQEVDGQVWLTLEERLAGRNDLDVLLDALNGNLDIMPKAVANDLQDRARKARREPVVSAEPEEIVVKILERGRRGRAAREPRLANPAIDHPAGLDIDALLRDLAQKRPDLRDVIASVLGEGQSGKAVTPRAEAMRMAKLRTALGAPPRGRGRPRTRRSRKRR